MISTITSPHIISFAITVILHRLLLDSSRNVAIQVGKNFDEMTFNVATSGFDRCGDLTSIVGRGEFLYIHCFATLVARYVAVYMDAIDILQICEFEVYQEQGKESTYSDLGYFCMFFNTHLD